MNSKHKNESAHHYLWRQNRKWSRVLVVALSALVLIFMALVVVLFAEGPPGPPGPPGTPGVGVDNVLVRCDENNAGGADDELVLVFELSNSDNKVARIEVPCGRKFR